jgi:hypothetical protein
VATEVTGTPFSINSTLALGMTAPDGSDTMPRMTESGEATVSAVKAKMKLNVHLNLRENRDIIFPSEIPSGPVS